MKSYIKELDGLRGLAILPVIFIHSGIPFFKGGFIGVDVFFTLSGFLITSLLLKEINQTSGINFKNFYKRRIIRLAPLFLLYILVYDLYFLVFTSSDILKKNLIDSAIALTSMTNWAWAFSIHQPDLLRHTWSLSVEEQFYLIWPALLLLLTRIFQRKSKLVYFTIVLVLASWFVRVYLLQTGHSIYRVYNGLDTKLDSIMAGCTLAIILECNILSDSTRTRISIVAKYLSPVCLFFLLGICAFFGQHQKRVYIYVLPVVNVCTITLLTDTLLNTKSLLKSLLSMKWLVWIGKISYGLYLLNYPIIRYLYSLGFHYSIIAFIGTISSIGVASLSYILYEKRFLRLKYRYGSMIK